MKVTIFGFSGSGKGTITRFLSELLPEYKIMSSGNIFREMAEEMKLTVYELDELSKTDSKYDIELDNRVKKYGEENDNFIFESRLAWHFIPDSIKIKLECSFEETVRRISKRDEIPFETAYKKTKARNDAHIERYPKYYQIEYPPSNSIFDMIIDTEENLPEEIAKQIASLIRKKEEEISTNK